MALRILAGIVIGALITLVVGLRCWHNGYDAGYGTAMADAYLDVKSPEQFFKDITGAKDAGRGVSH